jgi:hypothetical protein
MDHSPHSLAVSDSCPDPVRATTTGPVLSVLTSRFRLAQSEQPAPDTWAEGVAQLLGWLRVDAEFLPPARTGRLPRMADWRTATVRGAPVFAPWTGWSPAAFQHGGIAGLPQAHYAASYLIDHARGTASTGQGSTDLVLITPHPAVCTVEETGGAPIPRAAVMHAMIRAVRAEGRERMAIIVHARQRNAVARQLLAATKDLTRDGLTLDILTIEDALPALVSGAPLWDAVIAMPDLRSTVFTLLAHTSGVHRAWPMLWFGGNGELRLVTSEAPGEGMSRLALDAPALIHALALTLNEGGLNRAAWRLHEAWARLRDSGVTTKGHGGDGPYVSVVDDGVFLDMVVRDAAASRRPQRPWRAINNAEIANSGSQIPQLRVVTSNLATPTHLKGR